MAKTDLKLVSTDVHTGSKINTTIPYVNESASSATLKQYSQMLNALTHNNYVQTDRTQTINVDTEQVPSGKPEKPVPTITLTPATLTKALLQSGDANFSATWTGDYTGQHYINCGNVPAENVTPAQNEGIIFNISTMNVGSDTFKGVVYLTKGYASDVTYPVTLKKVVMIPATENYAQAFADITITES